MKILAVIPEAASVLACLDTALAAAEGLPNVNVDALHVMVDPQAMIAPDEVIDMEYLRIPDEGTALERAAATRRVFDGWCAAHPDNSIAPRWRQIVGAEVDAICDAADDADLLVVPRGIREDGGEAMYAVFFRAGRPFFVAPHQGLLPRSRPLSDCIVIAWNNSLACRRAVEASRPWLKRCREVSVLLIGADETSAEGYVAGLRSQGIQVVIRQFPRDRETLGDQIAIEAKAIGATLLVMGAYRHGAWLEWLLGHTTDQALRHADITFLMAH